MKHIRIVRLLALLICMVGLSAQAQFAKPEAAIKYRQSALTVMGTHFGRLAEMADRIHTGSKMTPADSAYLRECQVRDAPFADLDLSLWLPSPTPDTSTLKP